ncbi:MAG: hypothetical protein RL617_331, partial [Pseudomonadota bacterium]
MKSMIGSGSRFSLGAMVVASVLVSSPAVAMSVKAENFLQTESPWDMAFLKDNTMFFTEKCKGLSVRLPAGGVNRLLGVGGSQGYSQTKNDLFCDGQA